MMTALNTVAAIVILINGLFSVINSMGRHTGHGMRIAWLAMTTGAFGVLLGPLFGHPPPGPYWTGLLVGFALFVIFERRHSNDVRGVL